MKAWKSFVAAVIFVAGFVAIWLGLITAACWLMRIGFWPLAVLGVVLLISAVVWVAWPFAEIVSEKEDFDE